MISRWKRALLFGALALVCVIGVPRTRHAIAEAIASAIGTTGVAVPSLTLQTGGTDGTNLRTTLMDAAGRQIVIGGAADQLAASGNPVLVAGRGTNNTALSPRYCDKVAALTTLSTTATVQQIAAVASQSIYVCGIIMFASTATTAVDLNFTEGTGSNCGTGTASIGGKFLTTPTTATTSANFVFGPAPSVRFNATAGNALCITQSSTAQATTLAGMIFYTQG